LTASDGPYALENGVAHFGAGYMSGGSRVSPTGCSGSDFELRRSYSIAAVSEGEMLGIDVDDALEIAEQTEV
jgi:hypothetical protein